MNQKEEVKRYENKKRQKYAILDPRYTFLPAITTFYGAKSSTINFIFNQINKVMAAKYMKSESYMFYLLSTTWSVWFRKVAYELYLNCYLCI